MEDNNREMNGLDFNLEDIMAEVDRSKKEAAEALDKIYVPVEELEMKPTEPKVEAAPAEPNFVLQPEEPKTEAAPAEPNFVLQPDPTPKKPAAPEFDMKPAEPIEKNEATPDFVMTPSEKKEASETLETEFKGIDSKQMESASDAYDKAHDEAAGMSTPRQGQVEPAAQMQPQTRTVSLSGSESASASTQAAARPVTSAPPASQAPAGTTYSGGAHYAKKPSQVAKAEKPKKEKKYVTVGTLIGCMLLTLLLSTLLGSVLGGGFNKLINNNSSSFDQERAERNDSELSQLNLSDATGSELTVAQIVDMNENAVVEIVVSGTAQGMWGQMQLVEGAGSGVIMREDGYIATNYHVIQGANKVEVTLRNGQVYPARIIGSDPSNDVAVIKIDESNLTAASVGDSSTVDVGDLAVAIGNPLGQLGGSVTTGIISALDRTLSVEGTTLTLLQTDAAINGGNSGGGLFNSRGELIGIVESKASAVGVEGLAFALPINSVAGIINDLIENGGITAEQGSGTPAVGIGIRDVSEDEAQYYGLDEAGVYIMQVSGMNAMKAGFQEGDRIVSFNGKEVSVSEEFITMVKECKIGDTVTVVVSRQGQDIEIRTVLEERQLYQ